jgi:hypothetical protein
VINLLKKTIFFLSVCVLSGMLVACKCENNSPRKVEREPLAQFTLGQIVYKKINNEKVIIIEVQNISIKNGSRVYRVSTESGTDYFYEFELVNEVSTQTAESRNEIRY